MANKWILERCGYRQDKIAKVYTDFKKATRDFRRAIAKEIAEKATAFSCQMGAYFSNDKSISDKEVIINARLALLLGSLRYEDAKKAAFIVLSNVPNDYHYRGQYSGRYKEGEESYEAQLTGIDRKHNEIDVLVSCHGGGQGSNFIRSNAFAMVDRDIDYYFHLTFHLAQTPVVRNQGKLIQLSLSLKPQLAERGRKKRG